MRQTVARKAISPKNVRIKTRKTDYNSQDGGQMSEGARRENSNDRRSTGKLAGGTDKKKKWGAQS